MGLGEREIMGFVPVGNKFEMIVSSQIARANGGCQRPNVCGLAVRPSCCMSFGPERTYAALLLHIAFSKSN